LPEARSASAQFSRLALPAVLLRELQDAAWLRFDGVHSLA
jgi:hypothetical protein